MTRGGWSIHNIFFLEKMIALAFIDLREYHRQGYDYFDRNRGNIEAWYKLQAMEMLEKDQTLTGRDITTKCQALYHASHQTMMEHRARAVTQDPAIRFPEYWSAISDRPYHGRLAGRSTYTGPLPAADEPSLA